MTATKTVFAYQDLWRRSRSWTDGFSTSSVLVCCQIPDRNNSPPSVKLQVF
jgi:hypothetical protein